MAKYRINIRNSPIILLYSDKKAKLRVGYWMNIFFLSGKKEIKRHVRSRVIAKDCSYVIFLSGNISLANQLLFILGVSKRKQSLLNHS